MMNTFYTLSQFFTMTLQDRHWYQFLKSCHRKTQKLNPGAQRSERLQHVPEFSWFRNLGQCSVSWDTLPLVGRRSREGPDAIRLQSTRVAHDKITLGSSGCSTILWRFIFPTQHKLNMSYSLIYDKIISFN